MRDVQNNGRSTPTTGGVTGKGFQPGQSGNPGGRPRNFSLYIRQQTKDGQELVDYALDVFRGKHGTDPKLQMDAMTWLADRGFGKPVQRVAGDEESPLVIVKGYKLVSPDDWPEVAPPPQLTRGDA